ncbi:hypothetical protein CMEL01_06728 [Colletotrichum melonis]|uniref:Uncharacterized protein n=1 Tax=Colletotrichum melonis TaxID=1209925 RepID=A0AAI9XL95_9PEZI|nr:hypothetical protein CMEL01_06728 [Colletotrichum melonis]
MYGYVPAYRQTNAKVRECYSRLHTKYALLWVSIRLHDLHDTDGSTLYLCTRSRSHHSCTKDRARARRPHTSPQACQRRRIQPHAPPSISPPVAFYQIVTVLLLRFLLFVQFLQSVPRVQPRTQSKQVIVLLIRVRRGARECMCVTEGGKRDGRFHRLSAAPSR